MCVCVCVCVCVNADWAVHAAMTLGEADPYAQVPEEYAYRLRQRERQKEMPINQGGDVTQAAFEVVFGHGDMRRYP